MYKNVPAEHILKLHNIHQFGKVYGPAAAAVVGVIVFFFCLEKPGTLGDYAVIFGGFSGMAVYGLTLLICWPLIRSWERQAEAYSAVEKDSGSA